MNLKELLKKSENILYKKNLTGHSVICEIDNSENFKNMNIVYGISETPFGKILIARSEKGICDLLFITGSEEDFIQKFFNNRPKANFIKNQSEIKNLTEKIFYSEENPQKFKLHLVGTGFRLKVWQALLNIPKGSVSSYSDISKFIKLPKAQRAVGSAAAKNPVHYLIPCHRVIKSNGDSGGFAAGTAKKQALLNAEFI